MSSPRSILWGDTLTFSAATPTGISTWDVGGGIIAVTRELIRVEAPRDPISWDLFFSIQSLKNALPVSLNVFIDLVIGLGRMNARSINAFTNGPAPLQIGTFTVQMPNIPAHRISGRIALPVNAIGSDTWVVSLGTAPRTEFGPTEKERAQSLDEAGEKFRQHQRHWR
jgi:hypothetical protein